MLTREMSKLMKRVEYAASVKENHNQVIIDLDNYTIIVPDYPEPTVYRPTSTALAFHRADDRVRVIRGHVGSGKSTMMCAEIVFRAVKMAACKDGIRRSRWAIVRNTYGDLAKTTLTTWKMWFANLGSMRWREGKSFTIDHTFNAIVKQNGTEETHKVEMQLLPIALDNVSDVTKHLKSLEVTGVFLNELSELNRMVLDFFSGGRLPRFPSLKDMPEGVAYWCGIFADTNPPEVSSWIYKLFEVDKPQEYTMFVQPPAVLKENDKYIINPNAENLKNIQNGEQEYIKMTWGKSESFIQVYLMGEYGTLSDEKRVYYSYNDDIHSSDHIVIDYKSPLIIGVDLGTVAPAFIIGQMQGPVLVGIKEFCGEFTTIREMCNDAVMPWLHDNCKGMRLGAVVFDIAKTDHGDVQLREFFGSVVIPAQTNNISQRIDAVAKRLSRLSQGKPLLVISRSGCPELRKGFNGKYYYRRVKIIGEEKFTEEPYKNHPFSDCLIAGTKVMMADCSEMNIEDIKPDMMVLTPSGARKVTHAWLARKNAVVYEYTFSNGSTLVATPEHKIFTDRGWIEINKLTINDMLLSINNKGCSWLKLFVNFAKKNLKHLNGRLITAKENIARAIVHLRVEEKNMALRLTINGSRLVVMENIMKTKMEKPQLNYIDIFGKNTMGRFQRRCAYITRMVTALIIPLKIWNLCPLLNTTVCIQKNDIYNIQSSKNMPLMPLELRGRLGMELKRVWSGTAKMVKNLGLKEQRKYLNVGDVEKNMKLIAQDIAPQFVVKKKDTESLLMIKLKNALYVIKNFLFINVQRPKHVATLVDTRLCSELKDVYDITVEDEHCFFANGLLVHNCHDAWQYINLHVNYETELSHTFDPKAEALEKWEFKKFRNKADGVTGY